jgi:hypothetical protein
MILALDWVAAASIATAVATLVLAVATFASVRSANRAARVAELSLLANLRPLLLPSRPEDPEVKVGFHDDRWFHLPGNGGIAEAADGAVYLAFAVRNVGSGIAVLHGWALRGDAPAGASDHVPLDGFNRLTRDLYIGAGEVGFWQGTFRDPASDGFAEARRVIEARQRFSVEVLYGDHELGQRSITRFTMMPRGGVGYNVTLARHWNVDRPDPR